LQVSIAPGQDELAAETVLIEFGDSVPAPEGSIAVRLQGGAARIPAVVRALDNAAIEVEGLELHSPTLDDFFHQATGRRLEGAGEQQGSGIEVTP
jgi:hypothetical protein